MFCKNRKWDNWIGYAMVALGVVSFLYGLLTFLIVQPEGKAANTLLGMFTGFGFGIIMVAIITTIKHKKATPEQLEQEEIERNDERNIAIGRIACTVGMITAMIVFVILAFVFMGMGLITPSYLCIGGLYAMILAAKVTQKILEKKM